MQLHNSSDMGLCFVEEKCLLKLRMLVWYQGIFHMQFLLG